MKRTTVSFLTASAIIATAVSATAVAFAPSDNHVANKFSVGMPVRPQMFYAQDPTASVLRPVNNGYAFSAMLEDGKLRLSPHSGGGSFPREESLY